MSALLMTSDGDLDISTRNLVITSDMQTVNAQKLRGRLLMFLNEWFLDTRLGFPWIQFVLGTKGVDLKILKSLMRKALLAPGTDVTDILSLDVTFDPATRELSYTWEVQLSNGTTIAAGEGTPFVLSLKDFQK